MTARRNARLTRAARSRGPLAPLLVLAFAFGATPAWATAPAEVAVTATRIHLGDLVAGAASDAAAVDLGPSPAPGVSRLVTRADIVAALAAKQLATPSTLPDAVRVVRKAKHLAPAELGDMVRGAIAARGLPRGVTLTAVRADRPVDVADGWTRVEVDVPRAPKRAGTFSTTAIASLFVGDEVVARLPVPLELSVSAEGATFDVARGAGVTLVIRRNLVEIRAAGVAASDADVGDPIPVQLRPSGRVVRARLVSKDEAVALEGDR